MSKLSYKTRGGSSPQGKPRVYFFCHPADFQPYFEKISDEILERQDCAVWYDTEPEAEYDPEALAWDLRQMQLAVMPVTTRFLCQPNRARDVEFGLAMDACVPVLPLMQESGLEQLFNDVCGSLQALDMTNQDLTAIRYEEKLERFLSDLLVGDELARKVRAAFDAYVFLSYRKKDRAYAQKLMRLIHQNDFCRDIAIWYDEFLVPGEDFNNSIRKALRESGLFAMVVTPNLVDDGNYVMREEYPRAKDSRKPIFPVEVVPTDRQALKEKYAGLPECVSAEDEKEFPLALLEAVQKMRFRENEDSPGHLFFIGLAYLNGIDVEVDPAKGLGLISDAAERGLPEAMEKLVGMYWNGEAVKRDCRMAIRCQKKLVEHWQREYSEKSLFTDGIVLASALGDYGNYLYDIRDLQAAREAYERMGEVSRELVESCVVESCARPQKSDQDSQDSQDGQDSQNSQDGQDSQNSQDGQDGQDGQNSQDGQDGQDSQDGQDGQDSQNSQDCQDSQDVQDCQDSQDGQAVESLQKALLKLLWSYQYLAAVSMTEDRPLEARDFLMKMLETGGQLKEGSGTAKKESLFLAYNNLGAICLNQRQLEEAEGHFRKCLEIGRQLAEEVGDPEARRMYAVANHGCGSVRQLQLRWKEAETYYRAEYDIIRSLSEETRQARETLDLWGCHVSLSVISMGRFRFREAERHLEESLEISARLNQESGTVEARKAMAESYGKLALASQGSAWPRYVGALVLACGLIFASFFLPYGHLAEKSVSLGFGLLHAVGLLLVLMLPLILVFLPNVRKGVGYFRKGLEIRRQLYDEIGTVEVKEGLIGEYGNLSRFLQVTPFAAGKAEEYYSQYLELCREWVQETGSVQARYALAKCYGDWGDFCRGKRRREEAKRYFGQSVEMLEKLCGETKGQVYRFRLAETYLDYAVIDARVIGSIAFRPGALDREMLEKAYQILEDMVKTENDDVHIFKTARKHLKRIRRLLK